MKVRNLLPAIMLARKRWRQFSVPASCTSCIFGGLMRILPLAFAARLYESSGLTLIFSLLFYVFFLSQFFHFISLRFFLFLPLFFRSIFFLFLFFFFFFFFLFLFFIPLFSFFRFLRIILLFSFVFGIQIDAYNEDGTEQPWMVEGGLPYLVASRH